MQEQSVPPINPHLNFTSTYIRTAQKVQRLATGWTIRGSNPGGGQTFQLIQTRNGAHLASCIMNGYHVSSLGLNLPGRGVDHLPSSDAGAEHGKR